jgi:ABC-type Fe3+/spermidine/putrescine transport system ATPase subunit
MQQTAIYVTHDQEEAFAIADRIVLMKQGKVEQIGKPEEIYRRPATLFTARFLGLSNLIPGTARAENNQHYVDTSLGSFPISKPLRGPITVLIRPDSATLNGHTGVLLLGKLVEKNFRGNLCQVRISFGETELNFSFLSNSDLPNEGEDIQLSVDPRDAIIAFNRGTDQQADRED